MSDDTTTREAMERVRKAVLDHAEETALCARDETRDRARLVECIGEMQDAFTALAFAATTAERDRIRQRVAGAIDSVMQGYIASYPVEVWPETPFSDAQAASVMRLMLPRINAALADVARIIDADA